MGKLINFLFIGTVVASFFFADDGTCEDFSTQKDCLKLEKIDFSSKLCAWDYDKEICEFDDGGGSDTLSIFIVVLALNILVAPLDALLKHMLRMAQCIWTVRWNEIRREIYDQQTIYPRSKWTLETLKPAMIRAARTKKMFESMDWLDVDREFVWLMESRRRQTVRKRFRHSISSSRGLSGNGNGSGKLGATPAHDPRDDLVVDDLPVIRRPRQMTPSGNNLREYSRYWYFIEESVANRHSYLANEVSLNIDDNAKGGYVSIENAASLEFMDESFLRWQRYLIKKARDREAVMKVVVNSLSNDSVRDVYILRMFLVESMVGYRKSIAKLFFLGDGIFGYHEGFRSNSYYHWFCAFFVPAYMIFFCIYIFVFGAVIGPRATNFWLMSISLAFIQNEFVIDPMIVYFYAIFAASVIFKDVKLLSDRMFLRAQYFLRRTDHQMFPEASYLQHVNSACRLAKHFPHLLVSRILVSLEDTDMPASYAKRYFSEERSGCMKKGLLVMRALLIVSFITILPIAAQEAVIETFMSLVINISLIGILSGSDSTLLAFFLSIVLLLLLAALLFVLSMMKSAAKTKQPKEDEESASVGGTSSNQWTEVAKTDQYESDIEGGGGGNGGNTRSGSVLLGGTENDPDNLPGGGGQDDTRQIELVVRRQMSQDTEFDQLPTKEEMEAKFKSALTSGQISYDSLPGVVAVPPTKFTATSAPPPRSRRQLAAPVEGSSVTNQTTGSLSEKGNETYTL